MINSIIATRLNLQPEQVANTVNLLQQGCTIPFISRYRKEMTGSLNEVQIEGIANELEKLHEVEKRKLTILKTIDDQGKLSPQLKQKIENCYDAIQLEDIYLPYKPKRKTRAQIARDNGLEPLAQLIFLQRENNPRAVAKRFLNAEINETDKAIIGACDIIAEWMSENEQTRSRLRNMFSKEAVITSKVVKSKMNEENCQKYSDYFDFSEPLKRCSGNRLLAMRRGENEGFLRIKIGIDTEKAVTAIQKQFVKGKGECAQLVAITAEDAYKRLLAPTMETEFAALSKEKAEAEAIEVFAKNLQQLLLAAPLGQKRVMAVDPGIRTGCKTVILDATGNLLFHTVVYPFPPKGNNEQAVRQFANLARQYNIEAVSVGNGTAGRETADLLRKAVSPLPVYSVSEDGASVYSASKIAREEFPQHDVTVRGAVSIGRRLMDPLAELVKIDPKSIGVGQYQHDVDAGKLKKSLDFTVQRCVNSVGVNVNTAGVHLLTYISGLGPALAQNIVNYRNTQGAFTSRQQLKNVPRMGAATFEQCAGFLRIPNAQNPLDNTSVHPEAYPIVEKMARDQRCTVEQLVKHKDKQQAVDLKKYVSTQVGMPTLTDIMKELEKPGRDPRGEVETFEFDPGVHTLSDLQVGMELPGIITNITKFGAFVDIGVHHDGLIHISQLGNTFVADPNDVVSLQQQVRVKVIEIDLVRKRISLSMK